ncbi:MAG TPA: hydrogenase 4 subunit B [Micromonosporaceae bacterium]|nr:hydrogenase 4 subunit B [Micromonosporaceae bacterium]
MNTFPLVLTASLVLAATASLAGLVAPAAWRARVVGVLTAGSGVAGAVIGGLAVTGTTWHAQLPELLPLAGISLAADPLSGWFLLIIGAVTAAVGVYTMGYGGRDGHGPGSRSAMFTLPLFTAAMLLVPIAASVSTFLLAWELMAVASLVLVLTRHHRHDAVRHAGIWYAAMTQAGFLAILIGLTWLAATAGSQSFEGIRHAGALRPFAASGIFLLCLAGFASKAGAVPLHPWLPRAHAEAPSHVSALMSAAMVKLGLYGLLRVGFDLLGGGPSWWWLVVAALGALSALYGIVQAVVATDLKRLLAFSTSENVGLILLGVGFAGLLAGSGQQAAAAVAMAAALLHAANHAGFKTLLFLGAGSVLHATGTRDLDRLGGLSRRMPATTALFAAGALGAAALPPGNGFISEWLLLQALLHQSPQAGTVLAIAAPVAVAVVALTAGVGVAAFVKVVGAGFLARPRSDAAARATESPSSMLAAMGAAAAACAVLAVIPAVTAPALTRVIAGLDVGPAPLEPDLLGLRLSGITGVITPLWIAAALIGLTVTVATLARLAGRARKRAAAWDCGDGPLTARMEYTATSYAEPLQRVFDDALAPERDVDVTHATESAYHLEAVRYQQRIPDRIENRLYRPLITLVEKVGQVARGLASGSMHRYLAYMLTALIVVLVAGVIR